ncbi:pyroglutamyl-peptidase I [Rheinheimera riviphila]|uniref:Pyrrolidone-carboxylate peptidase n=1 Tax=Rheinheimera riviphila TaxID=1834037 RepID=A0A437QRL9_9GAMM|nr:pyroglutamyl-peptidase I [Rheinheimera riviphila]RVU37153.1 pyroglutamyl-peptidase I [Rheinheimera riviphila]
MRTILVTGFEPFGGEATNPSWDAVQQLDGWQPDDETLVHARQLPCVFEQSLAVLTAELTALDPVLVLAIGQAGGRTCFSLEKVAINYNDARIADNQGQQPLATATADDGPAAYFSSLPLKHLVQQLRQHGIPAEVSFSAGTFVCNHVFYGLMHALKAKPQVRAGFIHIPYSPAQAARLQSASMSTELVVAALKICIEISLLQQPDILLATGQLD